MAGLQFEVRIRELLGSPARSSVEMGVFRFTGRGTAVQRNNFTLENGDSLTIARAGKELMMRTDKTVLVTLTKADSSVLSIPVNSALLLSLDHLSLTVTYTDVDAPVDDFASIQFFQS